jgi:tRNA (guanine37-N1)-methyltransferase
MRIDIITLFPDLFREHLKVLPYSRAIDKGLVDLKIWDLRKYALDNYGSVDDKPYGGGKGMIMMIEPVYNALVDIYCDYYRSECTDDPKSSSENNNELHGAIKKALKDNNVKIISLSPTGERFDQKKAGSYTKNEQLTLICGRYEGLDNRIMEALSTEVISVGDYVLSGGETAALVVTEAVLRLFPGVLDRIAVELESFENDTLEYPQYTRPENFKGYKVPKILLSGDHKKIEEWRDKHRSDIHS